MSEKNLTEAEWKKFSKGHDWKDASFIKALAALDKAKSPEQELAALDELEKQADALRKSAKGDKELGGYLDDVDKSLGKQRKLSEAELKKAAAKDQGGDEEEESPALLTTKMIPLIRQVKKGEEMQALLANNGKEVAVMLSRRPISPSKRKLMAEYLEGGTPKYYPGTCIFEENAYTFVLKTQAGGLAKKLKAALLKQVELRLKVRVRGEDPNDVDDDGEEAEDEGGESQVEKKAEAGTPQPGTIPEAPPLPPDPLKAQFDKRMAALEPRVLAVLKAQTGDASKIRAVAEFAREKGEGGNYKAALAGMDSLEKLLEAGGNAAATTPAPAPVAGDGGAAAFNARLAALMPQVKEAIAAAAADSQDVKLKVSEAGVFARKKDFEQANALLDEAEELIEAVLNPEARKTGEAEGGESEGEDDGQDQTADSTPSEFEVLRARLESDYETATRGTDPALADQRDAVRRAWQMASDSFDAKDPARALLILKRLADGGALERLLQASRTAGATPSGPSLVAQRKFMLEEWSKMPGVLRGKLQGLRTLLAGSEADEDPDGLVDGIEEALEELLDEIKDTMDQAINDGDTAVFKGLRDRARSNGLMQHLMAAPDFDGGALLASVEGSLERIERAMVAA